MKGGIENKPNEPEFKMKIEPAEKATFRYKLNVPVTTELKITNITKDRQCYKVKCTDNDIFRVRPPLAFIRPDETASVKVTLTTPKELIDSRHFFAIYHIKCADEKVAPRKAWTPTTQPGGVIRIPAILELEGGEGTKGGAEEKKEEGGAAAPAEENNKDAGAEKEKEEKKDDDFKKDEKKNPEEKGSKDKKKE